MTKNWDEEVEKFENGIKEVLKLILNVLKVGFKQFKKWEDNIIKLRFKKFLKME